MKKEKLNECQVFATNFDITRIAELKNTHIRKAFLMRISGFTLCEISCECGISQTRVKQILLNGIESAKKKSSAADLKDGYDDFIGVDTFINGITCSRLSWASYSLRLIKTISLFCEIKKEAP